MSLIFSSYVFILEALHYLHGFAHEQSPVSQKPADAYNCSKWRCLLKLSWLPMHRQHSVDAVKITQFFCSEVHLWSSQFKWHWSWVEWGVACSLTKDLNDGLYIHSYKTLWGVMSLSFFLYDCVRCTSLLCNDYLYLVSGFKDLISSFKDSAGSTIWNSVSCFWWNNNFSTKK